MLLPLRRPLLVAMMVLSTLLSTRSCEPVAVPAARYMRYKHRLAMVVPVPVAPVQINAVHQRCDGWGGQIDYALMYMPWYTTEKPVAVWLQGHYGDWLWLELEPTRIDDGSILWRIVSATHYDPDTGTVYDSIQSGEAPK